MRKDLVSIVGVSAALHLNVDWHDDQRYYLGETVAGLVMMGPSSRICLWIP
jgi:hypothetical protein